MSPIVALLEDQALVADQREARRVGVATGRRPASSLPRLKRPSRIDAALVRRRTARARRRSRYSSLVMPMPCSPEITPPSARASAMMRATAALASLQHRVVVGVDRDVGVHVAVARVHVQRDEHAAAQHLACGSRRSRASTGANAQPAKISSSGARSSVFHDTTHRVVLQRRETSSSMRVEQVLPARARPRATSARASSTFASSDLVRRARVAVRRSTACANVGPAKNAAERVGRARACCAIDSSMLMRSMPSV